MKIIIQILTEYRIYYGVAIFVDDADGCAQILVASPYLRGNVAVELCFILGYKFVIGY
jgi:hypothetical protein